MKEKIYFILKKILNPTFIRVIILATPIILVIIYKHSIGNLDFDSLIDIKTFVAIIVAFICQCISLAIVNLIERHFEDAIKLTTDYNLLIEKYPRVEMFSFNDVVFPVVVLQSRTEKEKAFNIEFNHSNSKKKYELPSQIATNSNYLIKAHKHSKIYNNLNVRIDDIIIKKESIELVYSQTYYYDSMITNRVMDYRLENGKTIRDIYEPGPFLKSLNESKFSNHLGFNGFIELSDGKIIFVLRDNDLSIGKNTLASSIGASLKTKYALSNDLLFNKEGLNKAIIGEIKDELNIEIAQTEDLVSSIFAFCRDILEGGKPQFIFYYRVNNLSSDDFIKQFKKRDKKDDKKWKRTDGSKFIFLTIDEIAKSSIYLNKIILSNKKKYKMMPFVSSSLAMLIKHVNAHKA